MMGSKLETVVSGGQVGIAGAGSVVIENFTFYARAVEEPAATDGIAAAIPPCPYPGLAYFGPGDAALFFGRDTAIERLTQAVGRQSLTALVGASGSGKSSVVLAGLAPCLHTAGGWLFSHFRIGAELERNPFLALARALVPLYVASDSDTEQLKNTRQLATSLVAGELSLHDVFAKCRINSKGSRILLIADQFEEAFTLVEDETIRHRFIDVLLAGFTDPVPGSSPDICLIVTLRADFYGRALRHRPFADALQGHVENLGPMNRKELEAAIVQPATNTGTSFAPGLVDSLLDDVESRPGNLPLLQFALRDMWGRQKNRQITRESYDALGGVEGALAKRAEAIFTALTKADASGRMEQSFQRLFTRLVILGEGQEDTRRVVEHRELGEELWLLARRLADENNRLIVTNAAMSSTQAAEAADQARRETAEVVHEALIRHWPRLVGWIERDRIFLSWLRQIKANVELWSTDPADEGPLLRGALLAQGMDWLDKRRDDLNPAELGYIEASIALRKRAEEEKEVARQAELKRQQELRTAAEQMAAIEKERATTAERLAETENERLREQTTSAKHSRRLAIIAGVVALFAVIFGVGAWFYQHKAELAADNAVENETRALAGLSDAATERGNYIDAVKLALAAWPRNVADMRPRLKVTTNALGKAQRFQRQLLPAMHHENNIKGVEFSVVDAAFSHDERRILSWGNDSTVRLWDAATGQELLQAMHHENSVRGARFSRDDTRILSWSDNTIRLWDAATGRELIPAMHHEVGVIGAVFSRDDSHILSWGGDGTIRLWDAGNGGELLPAMYHEKGSGGVRGAAFSRDESRILSWGYDNTVRLWDAASGRELAPSMHHEDSNRGVKGAAFSRDESRILSWSDDSTVRLWNAATGQELLPTMRHQDSNGGVGGAAFSRDESRILSWGYDKTIRLWDAATGRELRLAMRHEGIVRGAAFSRDERRILSWGDDDTGRLWDAATGRELIPAMRHEGNVRGATFSRDERRILSWGRDMTVRLWDAATGRELPPAMRHENSVEGATYDVVVAMFSRDDSLILSWGDDNTVRLWDAITGHELIPAMHHENDTPDAQFKVIGAVSSRDESRILSWSDDGTVQLWDAASGRKLIPAMHHEDSSRGSRGAVWGATFSRDESRILSWGYDDTVRLWDAATGNELIPAMHHEDNEWGVGRAAFSGEGSRILSWGGDGAIRLWDAATGGELRPAIRLKGDVAFSRDGSRILSWSDDKTVRLWDAVTGHELVPCHAPQEQCYRCCVQ